MVSGKHLQREFMLFILLSAFILLLELAGGLFTNSLSLLGDAGHVFVDLLALLLAYFSMWLSQKKAGREFTFGYHRAEIVATIANGLILLLITAYIFYESYIRLISPPPVKGPEMLAIALIGLFANAYVLFRMRHFAEKSITVKGAYLHVLSDALTSVAVVLSGLLIIYTGNYVFDPVAGALIGLFILGGSLRLLRDSLRIIMEASPRGIDLEAVSADISGISGVKDVHDLHVWTITSGFFALTAHVLVDAESTRDMNRIVAEIKKMLRKKYSITHAVIQAECPTCIDTEHPH
ncbi:MAG: cation diffusion facilitator family transporter [Candidatus Micrarchaeota archaeon]